MSLKKTPAPPKEILSSLPAYERTKSALTSSIIELPTGTELIRAAWNQGSIWPCRVDRTYRFGPPAELLTVDGAFPYHWIYAASHVITAAWEARFCANDVTQPGTFFVAPRASDALVRIPRKLATYSTANWPPIPRQSGHSFHAKLGHAFHAIADSRSVATRGCCFYLICISPSIIFLDRAAGDAS
jgi:hypothetical protein